MIRIVIDWNEIAGNLGMSLEELNARLRELERQKEPAKEPGKEHFEKRFIYSHLNHGSGICAICAPWLNVPTTGTGEHLESGRLLYSDGVPVVPQHPRCKCYLAPLWTEAFEGNAAEHMDHFEWLESLPAKRLQSIIGKARAKLVKAGKLKVSQLYDPQTFTLIALAELGNGTQ